MIGNCDEFAAGSSLTRREFVAGLSAVGASVAFAGGTGDATSSHGFALTDVNVSIGRWPFRRLPNDEPSALVQLLTRNKVQQAWTGNFDALLHKDIGAANRHLASVCSKQGKGILIPFGSVNPLHPDWPEELRRCARDLRMPGIRLHPNYHGYKLEDPEVVDLLTAAAQLGLIVQIALVMEDERMMHPLVRVAPVDPAPLAALVKSIPSLRIVLVNSLRTLRARPLLDLIATDRVFVEISMLEGVGGLESLLSQVSLSRILFGSHAPLFYFESARLKLRESILTPQQERDISHMNARQLLKTEA